MIHRNEHMVSHPEFDSESPIESTVMGSTQEIQL